MVILQDKLFFVVKKLIGWHIEHYRAKEVELIEPQELQYAYPLADYNIAVMHLVTLRRYIC